MLYFSLKLWGAVSLIKIWDISYSKYFHCYTTFWIEYINKRNENDKCSDMTQSKNTECYIFARVTFVLHDFYYRYPKFIIYFFLNHGNGSESGFVSEESFFRGEWGDSRRTEMEERCRRRKRGFERKEGEEKESWGGAFLKRGAMLIWEKCKQHV